MFKIKFFYKACVLLSLFLLSGCEDEYYACRVSCSMDKDLNFTFDKTGLLAELEPEKISISLKNLNTEIQHQLSCRQNPYTLLFYPGDFSSSQAFYSTQEERISKDGHCFVPDGVSNSHRKRFSVRFGKVESGDYRIILSHDGEALSEFNYMVKHDYRTCSYCSDNYFELGDSLQPREWK